MNTGPTSWNIRALALSLGYATDRTVFAGTWGGVVFKSTDVGASWSAMNAGLGNISILSLALTTPSPPTLFSGTYGSSVWQYTFVQPTPTPTPTDTPTPTSTATLTPTPTATPMPYRLYLPMVLKGYGM